MAKNLATILIVVGASLGLAIVCGCENDAQTGALIGAGAGAGIGQAIGHNTESTLIGAGVGGGAGYMIGNESDKRKTKAEMESLRQQNMQMQQQNAQVQQEMSTVTVNIVNSNGSITPVTLRRQGAVYIGPRGETYPTMPTQEQLKQAGYGF
ncbi:MAG: YMGG-like glycine zipper-containing protein [Sedimentisphaerales bacterium]